MGAGVEPLSLYIASLYGPAVSRIIEIDADSNAGKAELYRILFPELATGIHFVTCNIADQEQLKRKLDEAGYDDSLPAIIVMEGLIYYAGKTAVEQTLSFFTTAGHRNVVWMDYLLYPEGLSGKSRPPYQAVLNAFQSGADTKLWLNDRNSIL